MNKKLTIAISILLIIAGILIQVLIEDSKTTLDTELIGFFSGFIVGIGIGLPVYLFFAKKKDREV